MVHIKQALTRRMVSIVFSARNHLLHRGATAVGRECRLLPSTVCSCMWRPGVFLEHGGGTLDMIKVASFARTVSRGPSPASRNLFCVYCSFLSPRSGLRMPPAERSALQILPSSPPSYRTQKQKSTNYYKREKPNPQIKGKTRATIEVALFV